MELEETLEWQLDWIGKIHRFNIKCGSYGDCHWQELNDNGEYVEFDDHSQIVDAYANEVNRLRALVANQ